MVKKRTQKIYLLRAIKKNIVSFLAVALMMATGISIYLGDQSAAQAILEKADNYFVENKLQSLEVSSVYGITEEDIEAIAKLDGVDAVEGGYSSVVLLDARKGTGKVLVQALTLLDSMNTPVVLEGKLPVSENEVAIEQNMAEKENIQVGDTITVEHDGELKSNIFEVTAIINTPAYCCAKAQDTRGMSDKGIGSAYYYISLPKESFDASYYGDVYTTAYIKNYELDNYFYFTDEYKEKETAFKEQIEGLGEERASLRFEDVRITVQDGLSEAEETLEKYTQGMADARALLESVLKQAGLPTDIEEAKKHADSLGRYQKAFFKIVKELEKADERLTEAKEELEQAKEDAKVMEVENWVVSIRNDIGDVRSIDIIVEGLYGLSYSMAIIFIIVSVTVCYSAISRMVSEQRTLIGMQKALGFTYGEILRHYMGYSIICGLVGVLEGWITSLLTVQTLSLNIYEDVFLFGNIPHSFAWKHAVFISVFFMIVFVIASYIACKKEIALQATELLRGEVPERDRPFVFEKIVFYQKLRLYTRTMIKNAFGDKPRMMTTIMGVAGCIILLVISFTMLIAMEDSFVVQFEDYFLYENRLVVDGSIADVEEFESILDAENIEYTRIQDKLKLYREENGNWSGAHVVAVSDAEKLKSFMVLEDPQTRKLLEVPEKGMLVSLRCAENHDLQAGSVLEIMGSDGKPKKASVTGVIEHYLGYNLFVVSDNYYEDIMEEKADLCVFLLKGNVEGLYDKVRTVDGFLFLRDNSDYTGMGDALTLIVMICFVFAAIMAVLVMLNQNVMYINRKAKELSVMRINGFTLKETESFVSRDNFVLTFMGILFGCVAGAGLGYVVTRVLEVAVTHYIRTPSIKACLIAAAIGGIFAYTMNKIALRRIKRLNLTDVNSN